MFFGTVQIRQGVKPMQHKFIITASCFLLAVTTAYAMTGLSSPNTHSVTTTPATAPSGSSQAGYVSLERIVTFENVKILSPPLKYAVEMLRSGNFGGALAAFQAIQRHTPAEALAYRGEDEAARSLGTLDAAISHHRQQLAAAEAQSGSKSGGILASLHYALGDALSMKNYPTPIGANPRDLGPEPKLQLQEAIRLNPRFLEARLALAAYYEHRSQMQGTAARREYDICLRLRPDLYQIRFLHAASWDRPGFLGNEAQLRAGGILVSDDKKSFPQRAIAECLALVHDHPNYAPPYYQLGSDYANPIYPTRNDVKARHYLAVYAKIGDPSSAWGQYATAELKTLDLEMAGSSH